MVPRKATLTLLAAVLCTETTAAFVTAPSQSLTRSITRPRAAVASPFEDLEKERQKKDNNDDNDDDWTEVEGGFIPRIGRRRLATPIVEVDNLIDYKKEVVDCEEEIVVVKFYSTWCRTCKAMAPLYKKLSRDLTATSNASIKFVQVPVSAENAVLHKGLGVPSVPFGHIYHKGAGLVEEQSLNKKEFRAFKDTLQSYVDGNCEVSP